MLSGMAKASKRLDSQTNSDPNLLLVINKDGSILPQPPRGTKTRNMNNLTDPNKKIKP